MKNKLKKRLIIILLTVLLTSVFIAYNTNRSAKNDKILSYIVDPKTKHLQLFWKNDNDETLKNFQNLKNYLLTKNKTLDFAMNGGMFNKDFAPQGLFIQNKKTLAVLDTASGNGNFYLKPNGIFYVTDTNNAYVAQTSDFTANENIKFATQSGPMLVIDGQIHLSFREGSTNLNIRNGVGILPNNKVIFAMSKTPINFYDFAKYFQDLGCKNALYLDGFVSRTYLPSQNWIQTDGNFGVMIGVTTNSKQIQK